MKTKIMIANPKALNRLAFLVCLFLIPQLLNAKIKTIELHCIESEVYAGNNVSFSLKTITQKGRVYWSTNDFTKYDFSHFDITTNIGASVILENHQFASVSIPKGIPNKKLIFQVRLKSDHNINFEYVVPIIDYKEQVQAVTINLNRKEIRPNTLLKVDIIAEMEDGGFINVVDEGQITRDDFEFNILSGGEFTDDQKSIRITNNPLCETSLELEITLKSNPTISNTFSIPVVKSNTIIASFSGKSVVSIKEVIPEKRPTHKPYGQPIICTPAGTNGANGADGKDGGNGGSAPDLEITLERTDHPCHTGDVIQVTVLNKSTALETNYFLIPNTTILHLNANGGDGGEGWNGGNGINGTNGDCCIRGGDGGDSGNGGDGGNGGKGATITVYYTPDLHEFIDQIIIDVHGGLAALGGFGGKAGQGGFGDGKFGPQGANGRDGSPSKNGRNGRDGRDGIVYYIQI